MMPYGICPLGVARLGGPVSLGVGCRLGGACLGSSFLINIIMLGVAVYAVKCLLPKPAIRRSYN